MCVYMCVKSQNGGYKCTIIFFKKNVLHCTIKRTGSAFGHVVTKAILTFGVLSVDTLISNHVNSTFEKDFLSRTHLFDYLWHVAYIFIVENNHKACSK